MECAVFIKLVVVSIEEKTNNLDANNRINNPKQSVTQWQVKFNCGPMIMITKNQDADCFF